MLGVPATSLVRSWVEVACHITKVKVDSYQSGAYGEKSIYKSSNGQFIYLL